MKKIICIVTMIVFLLLIKYGEVQVNKNYDREMKSLSFDLINEKSKIEVAMNNLNITTIESDEEQKILNDLKSGDKYHLHDPIYKEVVDFINRDNSESINSLINNAKEKGIRCAYVMVYAGGLSVVDIGRETSYSIGGGVYPLIGFDTINKGMMYFEPETDYQVKPVIGESYTDCIVGDPYFGSDDNITNILEVW